MWYYFPIEIVTEAFCPLKQRSVGMVDGVCKTECDLNYKQGRIRLENCMGDWFVVYCAGMGACELRAEGEKDKQQQQ